MGELVKHFGQKNLSYYTTLVKRYSDSYLQIKFRRTYMVLDQSVKGSRFINPKVETNNCDVFRRNLYI